MVSFLTLVALPALAAGFEAPVEAAGATVLVTGATGRTGALLYAKLKADSHVENKAAQTSASWLSGGPFQCQIVPQAAPSFGQPRPISRFARAGRPYRPCLSHRRTPASAASVRS